jgi:hypothetical protein
MLLRVAVVAATPGAPWQEDPPSEAAATTTLEAWAGGKSTLLMYVSLTRVNKRLRYRPRQQMLIVDV